MYGKRVTVGLPEYFKDLHLAVSAIKGSPRIVSLKEGEDTSDKYINIEQAEWESAILNWARKLDKGFVQVLNDYTFCIAGKAENKRHFIMGLRKLADELEEILNQQVIDNLEVKPLEETHE